MRAVRQYGIRDLRIDDLPIPQPKPGEVLLRTQAVTICASDLHIYAEGNVGGVSWDRPFVPGHEVSAVVADSNGSALAAGTPVVIDPTIPCYTCEVCARGHFHLCPNQRFCDLPPTDGAMQEYFAWPAQQVFPVPESLELIVAPLLEPLCVGVHATELPTHLAGATVAIVGCGAIGLCTLQMARVRGAKRIIATDLIPERLELARRMGADETILLDDTDGVEEIKALTNGQGVDIAFEAAGPQEAVQQCLDSVRPTSEVVIVGIPIEDHYLLRPSQLRRHELTLRFCRRQNENYPKAIALVKEGKVMLYPLLTHRFPVEKVNEAFQLAEAKAEGAVRVAVVFD